MVTGTVTPSHADLNKWHHAIHQVTGEMALHFNEATAADLERWANALREVVDEMDATRRVAALEAGQ
jgi:hypothetical protein